MVILKEGKHIDKLNSSYLCTGLVWQLFLGCLPDTLEKVALIDIWWEVLFLVPSLKCRKGDLKVIFRW